jgi:2-keto-4-pentenoate hydratase
LECCARLGRPLRSGQVVSTGATTGIHEIRSGQRACVRFYDQVELLCRAVPATPALAGS